MLNRPDVEVPPDDHHDPGEDSENPSWVPWVIGGVLTLLFLVFIVWMGIRMFGGDPPTSGDSAKIGRRSGGRQADQDNPEKCGASFGMTEGLALSGAFLAGAAAKHVYSKHSSAAQSDSLFGKFLRFPTLAKVTIIGAYTAVIGGIGVALGRFFFGGSDSSSNTDPVAKGKELERQFQDKAKKLSEIKGENTTLFEQTWSGKRTAKTIRVVQFNILAHGLSDMGCGFATNYKKGAPSEKSNHVQNMVDEWYDREKPTIPPITQPDPDGKKMKKAIKDIKDGKKNELLKLRKAGKAAECMSAMEKKWLHSEKYRELLFGRTWGPQPYGVPERIKRAAGLILSQCPDVVTLQEVDHYNYFEELFMPLGYSGVLNLKPMPTCETGNGTYGSDGVAIFWNKKRFRRINSESLELYDRKQNKVSGQRVIILVLEDMSTSTKFVVATGHFKSGDEDKHKPMKREHIDEVFDKLNKDHEGKPVIFAMDFNTDVASDAFQYFQGRAMGEWATDKIVFESAYELNDTDHFTTIKKRIGGDQPGKIGDEKHHTIDFIFHSRKLKCTGTLSIPHKNDILKATDNLGLPWWRYPSDHIMPGADLELLA